MVASTKEAVVRRWMTELPSGKFVISVSEALCSNQYFPVFAILRGNPVRQSKPVARWKEELQNAKSSNCVNGNNAPQSLSGGANSLSSNLSPTSPGLVRLPHGGAPPLASKPNDVWAKSQQTPQMNRLNPWSEGGGGGPGPNMGHQPHPQSPNHISSRDPSLATPGWGSMDASGNVGVHGLASDAQHSPLSGNSGISSKSVPGTPNTPSSSGSGWGSIDASSPNNPQQYWGQKARSVSHTFFQSCLEARC